MKKKIKQHQLNKTQIRIELVRLLQTAIEEGIHFLNTKEDEIENKKKYFYSDWDSYRFGTIGSFDSGVVRYDSGRKFKYENAINHIEDIQSLPSWDNYHKYVRDTEGINNYYDVSDYDTSTPEKRDFHLSIYTIYGVKGLLGSYIHMNERKIEVNENLINNLVKEYVDRILTETIDYDIWIPIIYTSFENDFCEISERISIEKIPDKFQIARNAYVDDFKRSGASKLLIEGCSHAFVIKGYNSINKTSDSFYSDFNSKISSKEFRDTVDKLVGVINIICGEQIFYHQIFANSTSCVLNRYADIEGVSTTYIDEELPDNITDYGWLRRPRLINNEELNAVKLLFQAMKSSTDLKLSFAIRKLISASFRNNSEDALLDSTIGLESILSNDSKSEIVYRLSIRGALVCKLSQLGEFNPSQIRDFLKKIYDYRSAIVHGGKESDKKKKSIIKLDEIDYNCNYFSLMILRHCLKFFIDNPKYVDLKELENEVLNN